MNKAQKDKEFFEEIYNTTFTYSMETNLEEKELEQIILGIK